MPISSTQAKLAAAALRLSREFGIGGDQWTVTAAAGDGLSGPGGPAVAGTWAGRVKRSQATQLAATGPAVPVGLDEWHAVGTAGDIALAAGGTRPLAVNDVLTSLADPALRFRVAAPIRVAGYARYILEAL
jgi:hypothetical protein